MATFKPFFGYNTAPAAAATTEGVFTRKIPWSGKPDYPTVNYSHPISKGLLSYWHFGKTIRDIGKLGNTPPAGTGQSNVRVLGESAYDLNNDGLRIGNTTDYHLESFTCESRIYIENALLGTNEMAGLQVESATGFQPEILCQISTGEKIRFYHYVSGSGAQVLGSTTLTAGWHTVVWRRDAASGNVDLFLNGKWDGGASYSGTHTWETTKNTTIFENEAGTGAQWPYQASFCRVWNRALSDAEIKSLYDHPYQIVQPRTQYIPYSTAAAGGGFQPAWAMNSTLINGFPGLIYA